MVVDKQKLSARNKMMESVSDKSLRLHYARCINEPNCEYVCWVCTC
jgi:hypothetical protein